MSDPRLIPATVDPNLHMVIGGERVRSDDLSLSEIERSTAFSIVFRSAPFGPSTVMGFQEAQQFGGPLEESRLPWGGLYRRLAGPELFEVFWVAVPKAIATGAAGVLVAKLMDLVNTWLSHQHEPEVEVHLPDGTVVRAKGAKAADQVRTILAEVTSAGSYDGEPPVTTDDA